MMKQMKASALVTMPMTKRQHFVIQLAICYDCDTCETQDSRFDLPHSIQRLQMTAARSCISTLPTYYFVSEAQLVELVVKLKLKNYSWM